MKWTIGCSVVYLINLSKVVIKLLTEQSIVLCDFPEYSGIQGNDMLSSSRKTEKGRNSSAVSPRQTLSPRSCSTSIFLITSGLSVPPAKKKDPHTTSFNVDESMQNSNLEGDTKSWPLCIYKYPHDWTLTQFEFRMEKIC